MSSYKGWVHHIKNKIKIWFLPKKEIEEKPFCSNVRISSVQFSRSVMFDSLRPRESLHARPPCPPPTPRVHPDSRPSSQWCHPAISSSVVPFSSCLQSLPASESCPMSQLFAWGGHSFSFSIIPSKEIPGLISFRMVCFLITYIQTTQIHSPWLTFNSTSFM